MILLNWIGLIMLMVGSYWILYKTKNDPWMIIAIVLVGIGSLIFGFVPQ